MNIQKIGVNRNISLCEPNRSNDSRVVMQTYGLTMESPLQHDTVSFKSKIGKKTLYAMRAAMRVAGKKVEEFVDEVAGQVTKKKLSPEQRREWKINKDVAETVHNKIIKPQAYIRGLIHDIFDDLVYSEKNPKNLILEIHDREKSVNSIAEKAATRKWRSVKEILHNMTDLNGVKIVANKKAGKTEMDKILDRLIPMIKTGQLELKEIEIKRPEGIKSLSAKEQEQYDYASVFMLKKLVEVQEGVWNTKKTAKENIRKVELKKPQYTPGNYCALHLLLDCPNNKARIFEAQFMGAYVGAGKELDDILFKIMDGKHVDKKYTRIKNLIKELKADTTGAYARFEQYRKDALLALREKEMREANASKALGKNVKLFLSAEKYKLTPEYDLNNLMDLKLDCENKSAAAKRAYEEKIAKLKEMESTEQETNQVIVTGNISLLDKLLYDISLNKNQEKSKQKIL